MRTLLERELNDCGLTINSTSNEPTFTFGESKPISIVLDSLGSNALNSKAPNIAAVHPCTRYDLLPMFPNFSVASRYVSTLPLFLTVTSSNLSSPALNLDFHQHNQ